MKICEVTLEFDRKGQGHQARLQINPLCALNNVHLLLIQFVICYLSR